jgi:hypothetical protein
MPAVPSLAIRSTAGCGKSRPNRHCRFLCGSGAVPTSAGTASRRHCWTCRRGGTWGRLEGRHLPHLVRRDVPVAELRGCYRGWAALPHPLQQIAEGEAFVRGDWVWTTCDITPGDTPPEEANSAEIALSYTHEARGERGEIAVAVLPDGAVMTQTESASPDLVETPQYRTEVRRIAPSNGLLGNMRD